MSRELSGHAAKDCVERVSLTAINGEAIGPPNVDNPPREPAPVTGLEKPDLSILSDKFLTEMLEQTIRRYQNRVVEKPRK